MMKRIMILVLVAVICGGFCACFGSVQQDGEPYLSISSSEAKELMDTQSGCIVLDVRTEEEYAAGHIPGAVLIPDYEITARAEAELPDKEQLILVYCRSGRRSKIAAEQLVSLGYTNIREFGGIIDWPYEITTG